MAGTLKHQIGLRERNKLEKLERITVVARELLALKPISAVTTNEVASLAGVATGTLFLYVKTKGELLLLAQNSKYEEALAIGIANSNTEQSCVAAICSLLKPIVSCNREQVENGRAYLREILFGDGADQYQRAGAELMFETTRQVSELLKREQSVAEDKRSEIAQMIMAAVFIVLSSPANIAQTEMALLADIESQIRAVI